MKTFSGKWFWFIRDSILWGLGRAEGYGILIGYLVELRGFWMNWIFENQK
jgi:hypothetical protein